MHRASLNIKLNLSDKFVVYTKPSVISLNQSNQLICLDLVLPRRFLALRQTVIVRLALIRISLVH